MKHGIATESFRLGKSVLALAILGVFTKLLNIDLSKLHVLDISFDPAASGLIPGFLGLALMYTFLAFCIARLEAVSEDFSDPAVVAGLAARFRSKLQMAVALTSAPFSFIVYSMPLFLGLISIILLWSDSMAVLAAIWRLAFK
jgi:hypothetical protein